MSKALITDLYQLTMLASYFEHGMNNTATFEMFFRKLPQNWGYFLAAGLEDVINYVKDLHFEEEDIRYLGSLNKFKADFLSYLSSFRFTGDVWAVPEGSVVFPNEPLLRVTAPLQEAQFIETYVLNKLNFQTMIATKASRVVHSANPSPVIDFGLRRAHDESAAINGARACYIGGCTATSNVEAGRLFGIPVKGTHAHSFVMSCCSELEAFRKYVKTFPTDPVLLIDTYDVMQGAKNAIVVAKELEMQGNKLCGVRLDSRDLVEKSKAVRSLFDANNVGYVMVVASNDLNEHKIADMKSKGARIDAYGVGTEMITSRDCPAIGGVYKLVEIYENGSFVPKMKTSDGKQTRPGRKQVFRVENRLGMDYDTVALEDEGAVPGCPLLFPVIQKGERTDRIRSLDEIQKYAKYDLSLLPCDIIRITNPSAYSVEISPGLKALSESVSKKYLEERK
ncbi:nicotinate phosphoribosyltransferase [Candidatus Woesearchaeota archaeon]|nr:nicotinate phosphoribosyltransferase [Candidatus Woesearchaeota archaeon]